MKFSNRLKQHFVSLIFLFIILYAPFTVKGKDFTVNITVTNSTSEILLVTILKSENLSTSGNIAIPAFIIQPHQSVPKTVKCLKYTFLTCIGEIDKKGGKTEPVQSMVTSNNFSFTPNLTLPTTNTVSISELLDIKTATSYNPKIFIDQETQGPQPVSALYLQHLGGVIAYTSEIVDAKSKIKILKKVSPIDLQAVDDIHQGGFNINNTFYVKGSSLQNVAVNVPGITTVGVGFNTFNTYEMKLVYDKVGIINWQNDRKVKISDQLLKLPLSERFNIGRLSFLHPDLKLDQIDKAYVFNGIFTEFHTMTKLGTTNRVEASTFVTNEGTYNREMSASNSQLVGSSYLGYWSSYTNDLTGFLNHCRSIFREETKQQFPLLSEEQVKEDYLYMKRFKPELPNYTTKDQALADLFKIL